jgi:hypothetical protein
MDREVHHHFRLLSTLVHTMPRVTMPPTTTTKTDPRGSTANVGEWRAFRSFAS